MRSNNVDNIENLIGETQIHSKRFKRPRNIQTIKMGGLLTVQQVANTTSWYCTIRDTKIRIARRDFAGSINARAPNETEKKKTRRIPSRSTDLKLFCQFGDPVRVREMLQFLSRHRRMDGGRGTGTSRAPANQR